jgi:uncharacterized protein YndB with AHSA1/START domain
MDDTTVRAKAVVVGSLEDVRGAFTEPKTMMAWWAAWAGCSITSAEIDMCAGGAYRIDSRTKKQTEHYIAGQFLYVTEDLLAFTWTTETSTNFASTVFLSFSAGEAPGTTVVQVEHQGLVVENERLLCQKAWRQILAVLQRGLPRLRQDSPPPEVEAYLSGRPC